MKRVLILVLALLFTVPAWAGNGTIAVKDGTGAAQTLDTVTDGSGGQGYKLSLCDGTALASCLAITAGNITVNQGGAPWSVSGTVTTTPPSNASTNVTQFGGSAVATGTGASGVGIPRVTVANDSNVLATQSGAWNVGQSGAPWSQNITQWNSVALGSPSAYGTSPGAVTVPGVNAFITNTPTVTANAGTNLNTSALALDTSVNGLLLGQASTTSGQKGPIVQGAGTTNSVACTTGNTCPLSLDTNSLLRLSLKDTPANTNNINVNLAASAATVTTSPPSNASTNVTQFGGVNVSTGTGAGGTGIPRVTISNDSSLAANQSVNTAQIAGTATTTGNGTTGAGTQRVTISSDSTGQVALAAGSATIGALTANQSVNVAQINGVTPLMGNGVTGTGSARVTVSSDNSNSAGIGGSATGSAVPSAARYIGGNGSGNLTGIPVCDNWTPINQTANAKLVTGVSAKQTYICHIDVVTATAQNVALLSGTGSTCGTTPHAIAGGTTAATGWNFAANGGIVIGSGVGAPLRTGTAADDVCLFQSGAGQVSGAIQWTQF